VHNDYEMAHAPRGGKQNKKSHLYVYSILFFFFSMSLFKNPGGGEGKGGRVREEDVAENRSVGGVSRTVSLCRRRSIESSSLPV
jgi:hypothetical protein